MLNSLLWPSKPRTTRPRKRRLSVPSARISIWSDWGLYAEHVLLLSVIGLLVWGLVAVTSASMEVAFVNQHDALFYFKRQLSYLAVGVVLMWLVIRTPLKTWQQYGWIALPICLLLLALVLIPGIGHEVNGSRRWIRLGPMNMQVTELMKGAYLLYLAGYLVRHQQTVQQQWQGFLKPLGILMVAVLMILLQPDFGAVMVLFLMGLGMVFMSGVRLGQFMLALGVVVALGTLLVIFEPYRMQRVLSFRDPWADPLGRSYQLVQSLIAFGRGNWFGLGLGNGVQKLFYLPEAHTDFIFAVICEELGIIGGVLLVLLMLCCVCTIFVIGRTAEQLEKFFGAYLSYGVGLLIGIQLLVNIGVNTGLLPTKGLTLPFISYGGSSLLVMMMAVALVYRVQMENRQMIGWPR
jgi:cell division protein FtsW